MGSQQVCREGASSGWVTCEWVAGEWRLQPGGLFFLGMHPAVAVGRRHSIPRPPMLPASSLLVQCPPPTPPHPTPPPPTPTPTPTRCHPHPARPTGAGGSTACAPRGAGAGRGGYGAAGGSCQGSWHGRAVPHGPQAGAARRMRAVQLACSTRCRPAGSLYLPRWLSAADNLPVATSCSVFWHSVSNELQNHCTQSCLAVCTVPPMCERRQACTQSRDEWAPFLLLYSGCFGRGQRKRHDRAAIRRVRAGFKVPLNGQWQPKEWAVLPACNGAGRMELTAVAEGKDSAR